MAAAIETLIRTHAGKAVQSEPDRRKSDADDRGGKRGHGRRAAFERGKDRRRKKQGAAAHDGGNQAGRGHRCRSTVGEKIMAKQQKRRRSCRPRNRWTGIEAKRAKAYPRYGVAGRSRFGEYGHDCHGSIRQGESLFMFAVGKLEDMLNEFKEHYYAEEFPRMRNRRRSTRKRNRQRLARLTRDG